MIGGILAAGRRQAVARMTETVTVGVEAEGPPNPVTGAPTTTVTEHYAGVARVKFGNLSPTSQDAGGQQFAEQRLEVHLPVDGSNAVRTNDVVVVTASLSDPGLVGRRFRVLGVPESGQVTAHRFPVEEDS